MYILWVQSFLDFSLIYYVLHIMSRKFSDKGRVGAHNKYWDLHCNPWQETPPIRLKVLLFTKALSDLSTSIWTAVASRRTCKMLANSHFVYKFVYSNARIALRQFGLIWSQFLITAFPIVVTSDITKLSHMFRTYTTRFIPSCSIKYNFIMIGRLSIFYSFISCTSTTTFPWSS